MTTQVKPDLKRAFSDIMGKMEDTGLQESSFNDVIGNSSYLQVGEHLCTVQSGEVVVGNFGPQLVLVLANKDGATIKQYVSFFIEDEKTKVQKYSRGYLSLMQSLIKDIPTKVEYASELIKQAANNNTLLVDGLVGTKVTAVVAKGKKGFEVTEDKPGEFYVKDVTDGTLLLPTAFHSIQDAVTMAKDEGYNRAYNRVHYLKPHAESLEANETGLRSILDSLKK